MGFIMPPRTMGMNIKRLRTERKMSQQVLAKRAKITQALLSMLESGVFKNPTLDVLRRLAKALKVKPSALLD